MSFDLFFYGTLCDRELLDIVLGRPVDPNALSAASLSGYRVHWVQDQPFPMIEKTGAAEDQAQGLLVRGLSAGDLDRLRFYEGGFDYDLLTVEVLSHAGVGKDQTCSAQVFWPQGDLWQAGAPWSLADWSHRWGQLSRSAAREVMAHFGQRSAEEMVPLLPFFRARAWAQQLAQTQPVPAALRSRNTAQDVTLTPRPGSAAGFFRLDSFDVSFRRFDGSFTQPVQRGAFISYDAALVLPYDPVTDRVLLIEQLRYGPFLRGDPLPWHLEPIAGIVDAGEAPEDCARREAAEEAGLDLHDIRPILSGYAAPGYSTEYFHMFLALCPLDPSMAGIGGLDSENENIRSHVIGFDQALELLDSGEISQAPLAAMLLWLARQRAELRAAS